MGQSLLFFILMSLCSLSVSQNYMYHFINESKSWEDAQNFCRKNYSDLATVESMKDLERLRKAAAGAKSDPWIGLHNRTGLDRTWHWSLPGVEFNEAENRWNKGRSQEPNDNGGPENCVFIENPNSNEKWSDDGCEVSRCFICYDGSAEAHNTCANWTTAQHICRENNGDLISGLDQLRDVGSKACPCSEGAPAPAERWWIGLFRDTWSWSNESKSSFRNWRQDDTIMNKGYRHDNKDCVKLGPEGKFIRDHCNQTSPFICYDNLFILVKENKTWEEALVHCRQHHLDLAWAIDHQEMKRMIQERAKMADSPVVWVGLHYTCFLESWIWINGRYVSDKHENWEKPGASECGVAGAVERRGEHKWVKRNSSETHNFICACKGSSCK